MALSEVDFEVAAGEVHALLGENGAGKTTLVRILAGLDRPDAGTVTLYGELASRTGKSSGELASRTGEPSGELASRTGEPSGQPVCRFEARDLRDAGVAMVQQHFTLVPTLTAGENLALARPEGRIRPSTRALRERVERLATRYGLGLRADVPAGQLSVGEQQRLELIRALDAGARLLILDEPTAVLVDAEADRLLAVCRRLAAEGRTVVIITHRLGEVFAGCDRVTVLRRGRVVLSGGLVRDHDRAGLAQVMVGSAPPRAVAPSGRVVAEERLRVDGVSLGRLAGFDLSVASGEIVGVAGVDGNGQAELEAVLGGVSGAGAGSVTVDGDAVPVGDPRRRIAAGIAYIPSDRYRHALAGPLSLADNLELGRGPRWRPARRGRNRSAGPALERWDVRSAGPDARASTLSGGNAQKLVLARELDAGRRVVVAAYPTRGLDPDAARMISERIVAAAAAGAAVVWFGAELDELFAVADRIVVLATGHAAGPFKPPYDRAAIGLAMAGD